VWRISGNIYIFLNHYIKVINDKELLFGSGACFSKVPKLFGRISGDIILFVSSKRRRLETLQLFLFLFNLQHMKRSPLQSKQVVLSSCDMRNAKNVGNLTSS